MLRVDQLPVERHVEDAAGALDELGVDVELLPEMSRQTGGLGRIVSRHAVLDRDVH
jgi:hypothetical protein